MFFLIVFLKVAFCYWGDCRVCDHVSVTISALKSHLTEVNVTYLRVLVIGKTEEVVKFVTLTR